MINKKRKVYFVGAGSGDPELITVKGKKLLEQANAVLYTGSLIPQELLTWTNKNAVVQSSENMNYNDIIDFLEQYSKQLCVRLHTGDPSLYSTLAFQVAELKSRNIDYQVIPGVTAAFAAAASMKIEFTIPLLSQNLLLTRLDGKTKNPEPLENILLLKNTSLVFYLSATLSHKLVATAKKVGYSLATPAAIVYKASWQDEKIFYTKLEQLPNIFKRQKILGTALILLGDFLHKQEHAFSFLYSHEYKKELQKKK